MKWLQIKKEHLQQILTWRTSEFVTQFMYTDIDDNMENQYLWWQNISNDPNGRYWIMEQKGQLLGFVSLTNIDWHNKRGEWNYYIGEAKYGMLGGFIGAYVYNYAFEVLGLEKVQGAVMAENVGVRKIHQKLGDREVGFYEQHVLKNDNWHDVYLYEMTHERWNEVGMKFKKYKAEVEEK
ncbi:UDP-4-amino-4,6-dideoxy-N-acetyl-beta-L-altrosamine N-acetyltransferase [Kurthia populi]|uniref:UDP-4-amino-4, 6-dideoxy-N-acetyl-beta-L-altrosamine N-acetyltransferase n=1 Tax=Kurthia populi TaxID=1562132 RepID=A0ABW5Y5Z5_9BACL